MFQARQRANPRFMGGLKVQFSLDPIRRFFFSIRLVRTSEAKPWTLPT